MSTNIKRLRLLSDGPFGTAVAEYLQFLLKPAQQLPLARGHSPLSGLAIDKGDVIILALSQPMPRICEELDDMVFAQEAAFVSVILRANDLTVGPLCFSGATSCWHCWQNRSLQHSEWPVEDKLAAEYYSSQPVPHGPRGFLQPFALIAAAKIAQMFSTSSREYGDGDQVWRFHLRNRSTVSGISLGVHGCVRCGLHRDESTRTMAVLRQDLSYLWTGVSHS
jgi:hypothetical protein